MRRRISRTSRSSLAGRAVVALLLVVAVGAAPGCDERRDDGRATARPDLAAPHLFRDVTAERGLAFVHDSGDRGRRLTPAIMGGGAAIFDHDGDGDLDLYLTDGHAGVHEPPPAGGRTNRLFSQDEHGRFVDRTEASGLGDAGYGMGVAVGDVDNDGDLDVYVSNLGPDRLYRNEGGGRFVDVTRAAGIEVGGWSTSAAFADLDGDGWLDLFVVRYVAFDPARRCSDPAGRPEFCGPEVFPPLHDVMLRNLGDGRFEDVTERAGVAALAAAGLGVVCDDLDDDGDVEVYVANDAYPNHLWERGPGGVWRERALVLGAAYNLHGQPEAGMGVVAADLDGDAGQDLFVTHLAEESNTYYRNAGAGAGFADATGGAGLAASSMPFTGFGVGALDLELDGDLDLLIANGRVTRGTPRPDARVDGAWREYAEPNLLFVNDGAGRFTAFADPDFTGPAEISRGLALGDVDRDGDVDVLLANVEGPARLLLNESPRRGGWLSIRAVDPALRRVAVGARVRVVAGELTIARTVGGGSGYLSAGDEALHVGLGPRDAYDRIEVRWPGGELERFGAGPANRAVELRRGEGRAP